MRRYIIALLFSNLIVLQLHAGVNWTPQNLAPHANSFLPNFTRINAAYFYMQSTPSLSSEPYITDLTPAGTHLLKDINPGAGNGSTSYFVKPLAVEGKLVFAADDGIHGFEPWQTDGTLAGTALVRDAIAGAGSGAENVSATGNWLYLLPEANAYQKLWSTDGTEANTHVIKSVSSEPDAHIFFSSSPVQGHQTFVIERPATYEVWETNGIAASCNRVFTLPTTLPFVPPVFIDYSTYSYAAYISAGTFYLSLWKDGIMTPLYSEPQNESASLNLLPAPDQGVLVILNYGSEFSKILRYDNILKAVVHYPSYPELNYFDYFQALNPVKVGDAVYFNLVQESEAGLDTQPLGIIDLRSNTISIAYILTNAPIVAANRVFFFAAAPPNLHDVSLCTLNGLSTQTIQVTPQQTTVHGRLRANATTLFYTLRRTESDGAHTDLWAYEVATGSYALVQRDVRDFVAVAEGVFTLSGGNLYFARSSPSNAATSWSCYD